MNAKTIASLSLLLLFTATYTEKPQLLNIHDFEGRKAQSDFFWHQYFPTVGLRGKPVNYAYLPHQFMLWELAPTKGLGVSVAIIDTGVAGFTFSNSGQKQVAHPDLAHNKALPTLNLNLVSLHGKDPIEHIKELLEPYAKISEIPNLHALASQFIEEVVTDNTTKSLNSLLIKYGKPSMHSGAKLTKAGIAAVQIVAFGKEGIKPCNKKAHFDVAQLASEKTPAVVQFIPTAHLAIGPIMGNHGSYIAGLINGHDSSDKGDFVPKGDWGIVGLAPNIDAYMIKAFDHNGDSRKSIITRALIRAKELNVQIANLSLKISDTLNTTSASTKEFKNALEQLPYVIVASGNVNNPKQAARLSYPARFGTEIVDFSIGAFDCKAGKCSVAPYSQYEAGMGPDFLLPGTNIVSSGATDKSGNPTFILMDGTSGATALMSGFVALVLGEFQHDFSQDQLKTVIRASARQLTPTKDWKTHSTNGVLDMRLALFTLHLLRAIKKRSARNFDTKVIDYVERIQKMLTSDVKLWSKEHLNGMDFETHFASFVTKAKKQVTLKHRPQLQAAIDTVVERILKE